MPDKALVVDANILVRAVLGTRTRELIDKYAEDVSFFVPDIAFAEAEEHLPALIIRRGGDPQKALAFLHALGGLVETIGNDVYGSFEAVARQRLGRRDPEDWPILGAALGTRLPDLDRRYRFLRLWSGDMDVQRRRTVPSGIMKIIQQ